ncbi:NADH-quinone oxidoreductase subunit L [Helicobacter sp. 16-1353]|uniref:NADH-quinone oxidoreductase subunit L n=1 Tax=Helicobacter sp. 16-1353 TaxID=2004996 RepID=UPI000DCE908E|nr:NADH-quinone oxidoreductase subunit L [Helicobacter sp. 16-1353]RAX54927.1 NADH-quinone oxidoreductase subunit L [Helicobacter sp. 16-1353]
MLLAIILFAPLFGSLFASLFAFKKKMLIAAIVPVIALTISLISAFVLFPNIVDGYVEYIDISDWIIAGSLNTSFGFMVDGVTMIMILVVLVVSLLVHIYSIGYMSHDECFNKFFAFLSAFVFSMLVLVMSDNFLGLFIGWEGVGLCSWMLIGFWYKRESASFAANEAFIMNRIADLGMLLGIFLIFYSFGSLRYIDIFPYVGDISQFTLNLIGILLFIGAMGKSAQFPLHTWLADAMEGPTPVSALIHAATMVTAGVYLVIRANPIYDLIPNVSTFITYLGAFVAIFAATMALVNRDLKRIIAYSTLSQLGYMFVAAGLGYYWIALFHLMTHAFFKSLLFLGAGNVMHAMNDNLDITKMGGLYKPMKWTAILMTIASIALAGIYPFAGFFSKDKILEAAFIDGSCFLWAVLLLGALLTAFYSFRLLMLVFFTPKRYEDSLHPHEASSIMILSLLPLGILAIFIGFVESNFHHYLENYYLPLKSMEIDSATLAMLIAFALVFALTGIIMAIIAYKKGFKLIAESNPIYKLLFNQYYIPKIYNDFIMKPYKGLSRFFWREIDLRIIDFVVDFIARIFVWSGEKSRITQSGNLSQSLILMICGIFTLLIILLLIF